MDKESRGKLWDSEFISCTIHPDRRCSRSGYVNRSDHHCGSCRVTYRRDGTQRPANKRYNSSEQRKWTGRSLRKLKKIKENHL